MTERLLPGAMTRSGDLLPDQGQGIQGQVLRFSGNLMPSLERRPNPQPIQTKIWIFSGRVKGPGSPRWSLQQATQHPSLLGWVLSDALGRFEVGLPPGEYTLLLEQGSDVYLNHFLEDGSYAAIQVDSFEVRDVQLANTEAALF
jgi:hypothetical protein